MATFLLILSIIFGIATITTFIIACCTKYDSVTDVCSILCCIFLSITVSSAMCYVIATREKTQEFSAVKYEFKYKVTEFDGVSDTTYVLIRKK